MIIDKNVLKGVIMLMCKIDELEACKALLEVYKKLYPEEERKRALTLVRSEDNFES